MILKDVDRYFTTNVVSVETDKKKALTQTSDSMKVILAKAICKGITRKEIHELVDGIYDEYMEDN